MGSGDSFRDRYVRVREAAADWITEGRWLHGTRGWLTILAGLLAGSTALLFTAAFTLVEFIILVAGFIGSGGILATVMFVQNRVHETRDRQREQERLSRSIASRTHGRRCRHCDTVIVWDPTSRMWYHVAASTRSVYAACRREGFRWQPPPPSDGTINFKYRGK